MTDMGPPPETSRVAFRFRRAYAELRRREGRDMGDCDPSILPYVRSGALAAQWRVRARSYERFIERVVVPREQMAKRLRVLDLGAGNGWLCSRLQLRGHRAIAVDWRDDDVDGLGAARGFDGSIEPPFSRVAASFEALPFAAATCDLVVFNASLHYATDLRVALSEAVRMLSPTGVIAILDSPFYRFDRDGDAMVSEKRTGRVLPMGDLEADLLALPSIEYLTEDRLRSASAELGLSWRRHRVLYPLGYELRPLLARLHGRRTPSRFDVWEGRLGSGSPAPEPKS
jgi:SAM-dependent methyltransferase